MSKNTSQKITTTLKLVTPQLAEEMLTQNTNNRHISKKQVERMVYAMKNDQWKANGETIKISSQGKLIDGQHRLTAIIQANVACLMLVCDGISEEAIDTIDIGKRRTFGDWLNINGEENPTNLSAALHKLAAYEKYYASSFYVKGGLKNLTYQDLEALLRKHAGIRHSVAFIAKNEARRIFDRSILSALHYLFTLSDSDKAEEFFSRLGSGANLDEESPILGLRQVALRWRSQNHRPEIYEVMTFIIRAWNAFCTKSAVQHFRFNPGEQFPVIHGLNAAKPVTVKPRIIKQKGKQ